MFGGWRSTVLARGRFAVRAAFAAGAVDYASTNPTEASNSTKDPPPTKSKEQSTSKLIRSEEADRLAKTMNVGSSRIPESIPYLIVGSGAAAYYASLTIRARDADAKVLIVGDEPDLPYNRPPLSKELWWHSDASSMSKLTYKGANGKNRDIFFETDGFFVPPDAISDAKHGGVSLIQNTKVKRIDTLHKIAYFEDGRSIGYEKCLLATGGRPRKLAVLEPFGESEKVLYLRNISDFHRLNQACSQNGTITIIGGGLLGSEIAYSIKRKYPSTRVVQIIREKGPLANILPLYLSAHTRSGLERTGVEIHTESAVTAVSKSEDGSLRLTLSDDTQISSNYIVVAVGIEPITDIDVGEAIQRDSQLGGFRADAQLRVEPSVWCAGDACAYETGILGRRRIEHWENAQITGRLAGENMTNGKKDFWYQASYFSKIGPDMFINAVGNTDSKLHTVSVFAEQDGSTVSRPYQKGVVFYRNDAGQIVGCLMINVFGAGIDVARRLIDEKRSIGEAKELAKLFSLWEVDKEENSQKDSEK